MSTPTAPVRRLPRWDRLRPRVAHRLAAGEDLAGAVQRRRRRSRRLALVDLLALALAVAASEWGAHRAGASAEPLGWAIVFVAIALTLLAARGAYRFRLESSFLDQPARVLGGTSIAATLVLAARVLFDASPDLAAETVRLWGFGSVYLLAGRLAVGVATYTSNRRGLPTLIIGAGSVGRLVARRLTERSEMGLTPVGFLDKDPRAEDEGDLPVLGASWDLENVVRDHEVEHVIVTFSRAPHEVVLGVVRRCRQLGVEVSLVPRLFEEVSNRVSVEHLGGVALLRVEQADPRGWQFEVKYALDRAIGCLGTLAVSPILLVLALIIRLTSPGPILFRQRRVGLDGREFDMLKFRSMSIAPPGVENDSAWARRALGSGEQASEDDADPGVELDRRTPIGRFIRRWSLDELPQVLNIARGDMSLVGPRPERTGYVEAFRDHVYRYGDRHRVKSGLTGWAQVNGLRGDTSLDDRIEWDNFYVENWTPWLDLKILLLTIPAVLSGRGAE